jgi:hypothetical protein
MSDVLEEYPFLQRKRGSQEASGVAVRQPLLLEEFELGAVLAFQGRMDT